MMKQTLRTLSIPVVVVTLLLAFSAIPVTSAAQGSSQPYRNVPGLPGDAVQLNRTAVTPSGYLEQVQANQTYAFHYQNVTVLMNCSRTMTMNVTIDPQVRTRYFGLDLAPEQALLLHMHMSTTSPPGIRTLLRTVQTYWNLEPDSPTPLQARLRLHINQTALSAELNRAVNVSRLTWMYWNGSRNAWVPVASHLDADGYLVCETPHFSIWTVAEVVPTTLTASLSSDAVTVGDAVTVSAHVVDEDANPVDDAVVEATIDGTTVVLTDQGDGNYAGSFDTTILTTGSYTVGVTAQQEGYTTSVQNLVLTIGAATPWMPYLLVGVVAVVAFGALLTLKRR
jgi:hypothetical protein